MVPVLVALKVGVCPATGFWKASSKVTVTVDVATPLAMMELVPVMVEVAEAGAPTVKTTVPPERFTGVAILRVFVSTLVEVIVQVETPKASVSVQAP